MEAALDSGKSGGLSSVGVRVSFIAGYSFS
jgi:hypothetical protein